MSGKVKLIKDLNFNILEEDSYFNLDDFSDGEISEAILESYKDSVDYEGEELYDFLLEIDNIKKGLYGDYERELGVGIKRDGKLASGIYVTIFKGQPTITYQFTRPEFRNLGLARKVILKAENILFEKEYRYIYAYLTLENIPAYNLYDSLSYYELYEGRKGNV